MEKRKRILVFIDWYLPGYRAGGPIQSCVNLVEHLGHAYEFLIVTRDTDYCETNAYAGISSNQWNDSINGSKVYYISDSSLNARQIKRLVEETQFDIAYVNGIYSFYFSILPLFYLRAKKMRKIVSVRGMLASSAIGVKAVKKKLFLHLSRFLGLYRDVVFQASTADEQRDIELVMGVGAKILLAPNFPKKNSATAIPPKSKTKGNLLLINIARIAPEKNLLFALEVLSKVKAELEFHFYGPIYNEAYFETCKAAIAKLPSNIRVLHKGAIESSAVAGTLQNYHALFMPTLGENFGHIIFESFQNGTPVLISDQTPWKHLSAKKIGFDCSLQQPGKFIETIENMASWNSDELQQWSEAAINYASQFSSNPEILKQNLHLFSDK